jgi:hypothetical protein
MLIYSTFFPTYAFSLLNFKREKDYGGQASLRGTLIKVNQTIEQTFSGFLAIISRGLYLVPSRTQQSRPAEPMILDLPGK